MDENARPKHAGNALLEHVISVLDEYGYTRLYRKPGSNPHKFLSTEYKSYIINYRFGFDLYKTKRLNHVILYNQLLFPHLLVIDCRWQAISGSVDQKYPFIVHSLEDVHDYTALILDGEGMRKEAVEWTKGQETKNHLVFSSLGAFSRWTRNNL